MTKRHPSSRARTARERILLFCMSTDSQRAGVTGETVTALTALTAERCSRARCEGNTRAVLLALLPKL
jgi:hypothetical protein